MMHVWMTLEYLWVHFAVYARAFSASIREVHRELALIEERELAHA